jgi:hypothetical protein
MTENLAMNIQKMCAGCPFQSPENGCSHVEIGEAGQLRRAEKGMCEDAAVYDASRIVRSAYRILIRNQWTSVRISDIFYVGQKSSS